MPAWEEAASLIEGLLLRVGAEDLSTKVSPDFLKKLTTNEFNDLVKAVSATYTSGSSGSFSISDAMATYLSGAGGRLGGSALKYGFQEGNPVGDAAAKIYKTGLGASALAGHKLADFGAQQYQNYITGTGVFPAIKLPPNAAEAGTLDVINSIFGMTSHGVQGQQYLQGVMQRNQQLTDLWHAPATRFARTAGERFAIDTANTLAVRGTVKLYDRSKVYKKESQRQKRLTNIFVASAAGTITKGVVTQAKAAHPSLETVTKSTAATYHERITENLNNAKAYYGSNGPETLGSIIGGIGSYKATNPHKPYKDLQKQVILSGITTSLKNAYRVAKQPSEVENPEEDPFGNVYQIPQDQGPG